MPQLKLTPDILAAAVIGFEVQKFAIEDQGGVCVANSHREEVLCDKAGARKVTAVSAMAPKAAGQKARN